MNTKQYQASLVTKFKEIFHSDEVKSEWSAFSRKDGIYSPRVDVAIGPFATSARKIDEYDRLFNRHNDLLSKWYDSFKDNMKKYSKLNQKFPDLKEINSFNSNARCFIAIEIEKSGSRKHLLGDLINASTLSRIGIIIPWDDTMLKAFIRQIDYFSFLKSVEKNTLYTKNLFIVRREQFEIDLNEISHHGI